MKLEELKSILKDAQIVEFREDATYLMVYDKRFIPHQMMEQVGKFLGLRTNVKCAIVGTVDVHALAVYEVKE